MDEPRFIAHCLQQLPPLAWLLDFSKGFGNVELYHGRHVDVFADRFFEGAWDGDFAAGDFPDAANVFGSGVAIGVDSMTLVPPSHTLESLVVCAGVASNSLAFLWAYLPLEETPVDWRSGELFASILLGIDRPRALHTRRGALKLACHHNATVTAAGALLSVPKRLPPSFADYHAYRAYLLETVEKVAANAADGARRRRYAPITTLSSGYDSAACAVLARHLGGVMGLSLQRSQRGEPDSGLGVAAALGLQLKEYPRPAEVDQANLAEAEFLSDGMHGEDYPFIAFSEMLEGGLLLTGFHGDKIWDKHQPPSDNIRRGDISGCSLGEFRLTRDFLHLPVPFIGCQRHRDLHRIANSEEMAAWSIGGDYDRPVPRRLAEEAGVPRAAFGQRKRAVSLLLHRHPPLLSSHAAEDIAAFAKGLRLTLPDRLHYFLLAIRFEIGWMLFKVLGRLQRLRGSRHPWVRYPRAMGRWGYGVLTRLLGPAEVFEHSHPRNALWHRWAVLRVAGRYKAALHGPKIAQRHLEPQA